VIGITLLDDSAFPARDIEDFDHKRWQLEEFYKSSKVRMWLEDFCAWTENGVRQEIYASVNLLAVTRFVTNRVERELGAGLDGQEPRQVNAIARGRYRLPRP